MIRKAVVEDARAMAEVHIHTWQIAYRGIVPDEILDGLSVQQREVKWLRMLSSASDGGRKNWVIVEGDSIPGWVSVGPNRDNDVDANDIFELYGIYLHPDFWDRGFGKQLMQHALDWVREQKKYAAITLWVLKDNPRARGFYESFGYARDGAEKDWRHQGHALREVRYRLELR